MRIRRVGLVQWIALVAAAGLLASCASTPDPKVCAAVGAGLGGGGGAWAGRETPGHDGEEIAGYGALGILVGGATGYAVCRLAQADPEPEPEPTPEPAPAPPPEPEPERRAAPPPEPEPDPCDQVIRLRGVNFDFDKSAVRPDAKPILDQAVTLLSDFMDDCGTRHVVIEGHTDAIGTDAYNQALSERRARSVRDYLVENGIPAGRLEMVGHGESRPVAPNDDPEGRAMNRRVELRLAE